MESITQAPVVPWAIFSACIAVIIVCIRMFFRTPNQTLDAFGVRLDESERERREFEHEMLEKLTRVQVDGEHAAKDMLEIKTDLKKLLERLNGGRNGSA